MERTQKLAGNGKTWIEKKRLDSKLAWFIFDYRRIFTRKSAFVQQSPIRPFKTGQSMRYEIILIDRAS